MSADTYAFWRAALANPEAIGDTLPIHDGHPQDGFYINRSRREYTNGVPHYTLPEPVAIWTAESGERLAVSGVAEWSRHVSPEEIWTWVASNPVTEDLYRHLAAGGAWPEQYRPKGPTKQAGEAA